MSDVELRRMMQPTEESNEPDLTEKLEDEEDDDFDREEWERERKAEIEAALKLVDPETFKAAYETVMENHLFTFWAMDSMDSEGRHPEFVLQEVEERYPAFVQRIMELHEENPEEDMGLIENFMMWHTINAPGRETDWWPAVSRSIFRDPRWSWHMERSRRAGNDAPANTLSFEDWKKELLATMPTYSES